MADHLLTAKPGSLVARMLQDEAQKRAQSAHAVLAEAPQMLDLSAWYEQHIALLHQFLHRALGAIANTPAKRNTKLVQCLGEAHSELKRHAALVAGDAIPTVLSRDGQYPIPYEKLAEARAKVRVLTAELTQAREEIAALKLEGWHPEFDAMSPQQEELVVQFCQEIAGARGKPGSPPDPVRLLEMAEALYEAERDTFCSAPGKHMQQPADVLELQEQHKSAGGAGA
ncbi:hypothetical protein [Alicycliphilus denitrificans]|uniref:hypothetical protein n=1 Tax=Alicycliphilus denitrificans TaxID=179636 RepID=UPI00384E8FD9